MPAVAADASVELASTTGNIGALFHRVGLADSGGAARKLIRGKGARLNDQVIEDETRPITLTDLLDGEKLKLSAGKKQHKLVRIV